MKEEDDEIQTDHISVDDENMYSLYYYDNIKKLQTLHTIYATDAYNAYRNVKDNKILMKGEKIIYSEFRSKDIEKYL